jgi:hypothetical protein
MRQMILVAVLLSGCGSMARQTMKTEDGGAVTIYAFNDSAVQDANKLMDAQCGAGKWKVTKEEVVQTGTYQTNWGAGITTGQPINGKTFTFNCAR